MLLSRAISPQQTLEPFQDRSASLAGWRPPITRSGSAGPGEVGGLAAKDARSPGRSRDRADDEAEDASKNAGINKHEGLHPVRINALTPDSLIGKEGSRAVMAFGPGAEPSHPLFGSVFWR
jgi:hypothetical protein